MDLPLVWTQLQRLAKALGRLCMAPHSAKDLAGFQAQASIGGAESNRLGIVGGCGFQPAAALAEPCQGAQFISAVNPVRQGQAKAILCLGFASGLLINLSQAQPGEAKTWFDCQGTLEFANG